MQRVVIAAAVPDQAFSPVRQSNASETTAPNICVAPNTSRIPAQNGVFRSLVCIIQPPSGGALLALNWDTDSDGT